jgi:hypothetical protein
VKESEFSGFGHRLGNLLPCCKSCNSEKGNKDWRLFLRQRHLDDPHRVALIEAYLDRYRFQDVIPSHLPEYQELQCLKKKVLQLLAEADEVAKRIRKQTGSSD